MSFNAVIDAFATRGDVEKAAGFRVKDLGFTVSRFPGYPLIASLQGSLSQGYVALIAQFAPGASVKLVTQHSKVGARRLLVKK